LPQYLPDRQDAQPKRSGNRLLGLPEFEPTVNLMPQISLDHSFSFRRHRRKEQYTFLMHVDNPFLEEGGLFFVAQKGLLFHAR
jgi:hypothetical protein